MYHVGARSSVFGTLRSYKTVRARSSRHITLIISNEGTKNCPWSGIVILCVMKQKIPSNLGFSRTNFLMNHSVAPLAGTFCNFHSAGTKQILLVIDCQSEVDLPQGQMQHGQQPEEED